MHYLLQTKGPRKRCVRREQRDWRSSGCRRDVRLVHCLQIEARWNQSGCGAWAVSSIGHEWHPRIVGWQLLDLQLLQAVGHRW